MGNLISVKEKIGYRSRADLDLIRLILSSGQLGHFKEGKEEMEKTSQKIKWDED